MRDLLTRVSVVCDVKVTLSHGREKHNVDRYLGLISEPYSSQLSGGVCGCGLPLIFEKIGDFLVGVGGCELLFPRGELN